MQTQRPTAITMKRARRIYRNMFTSVTRWTTTDAEGVVSKHKLRVPRMNVPTFRQWTRASRVFMTAQHQHPVGKLARVMGAVS